MATERTLGVLMPPGKMANVPGCMACEDTFPYRTLRTVVEGSIPPRNRDDVLSIAPMYLDAVRRLEGMGADVITTACGLVALLQPELASAVRVPVLTSTLLMAPAVSRIIGGRKIGILTFFQDEVGENNFRASGWSGSEIPVTVAGVGTSPSWLKFLETKEAGPELLGKLESDLVHAADALVEREPEVGALLLECTLLPAAVKGLRARSRLPVFDVLTMLDWAMSGLDRFPVRAQAVPA